MMATAALVRRIELGDELVGRVGVVDVVVRQLLALDLPRRRDAGARLGGEVERGALVRILAVAQRAEALVQHAAEGAPFRRRLRDLPGEPVRDRRVVGRGAGIGLLRHPAAEGEAGRPAVAVELVDQRGIVGDVDDDRDVVVVLGRAADHRRAADVDVLDPVLERRAGAVQRRLERIEIDDQKVDRGDVVGDHRRLMGRVGADREQPAVDARMQRLHPPVHHLGKAGDLRDVDDREPGLLERRGGAAGRQELDAVPGQRLRQLDEAGLVGDGDQRPPDLDDILGHRRPLPASADLLRRNSTVPDGPERCEGRMSALRSRKNDAGRRRTGPSGRRRQVFIGVTRF